MIYIHRYYTKLKKNATCEKRVACLEPLHGLDIPEIAVTEYISQFPVHIPHGKSSKQLYDEILLEGNSDTFPRDSKQIRAKKYNYNRRRRIDKGEHLYRQKLTVLAVMNMTQDRNCSVKSSIVTVRNTECLYKLCTVEGKKGY